MRGTGIKANRMDMISKNDVLKRVYRRSTYVRQYTLFLYKIFAILKCTAKGG